MNVDKASTSENDVLVESYSDADYAAEEVGQRRGSHDCWNRGGVDLQIAELCGVVDDGGRIRGRFADDSRDARPDRNAAGNWCDDARAVAVYRG
ncbi:unnamed protein product [Phytophthora fragariaefolia]|uniref:Unnamed protein product n=1 Tax=Phytophthora fragariaefolia TaxID=1490495 RepID=A0A9W6YQU1_9STRA|nr:unnamed protein product [Phytophthora fragariaefolia]